MIFPFYLLDFTQKKKKIFLMESTITCYTYQSNKVVTITKQLHLFRISLLEYFFPLSNY